MSYHYHLVPSTEAEEIAERENKELNRGSNQLERKLPRGKAISKMNALKIMPRTLSTF